MPHAKPIIFRPRDLIILPRAFPKISSLLLKIRFIRKFWFFLERCPPFIVATLFSSKGIWSHQGRLLVWGKARRITLSFFLFTAKRAQRRYGLEGECTNCGASCNLLFQCPHWNKQTRLCTVYEDRPNICKTFPITPSDIRDRDIGKKEVGCGYTFAKIVKPVNLTAKPLRVN